tara:strand:+ start:10591 stop:12204 length:1614 start_codon:yes stop_codon:yes gene_type:complete
VASILKNRFKFSWIILIVFCELPAQTHYILPPSVWRFSLSQGTVSGNWISSGGKSGLPNEVFALNGYNLRYYNPSSPTSNDDLVGLGDMYINSTDQVKKVIRDFNDSDVAATWGDSLADFTQDFFGPDSFTLFGYITNDKRKKSFSRSTFRIEYGLSERNSIFFEIPVYRNIQMNNDWGWENNSAANAQLQAFTDYHSANREKMAEVIQDTSIFNSLDEDLSSGLKTIYSRFYSFEGSNSMLWAINGGADPFTNGIYGSEYNPFTDSDTIPTTIDSLISFYHPNLSASGLGDMKWGMTILLYGSPAWQGESLYSVYGGMGMTLPTGRIIDKFNGNKIDVNGRPEQFSQLSIGEGITQWYFSLFGEFYKEFFQRLIRLNWNLKFQYNLEGRTPTRVSPRGIFSVNHDSILTRLGEDYRWKKGDIYSADISGFAELIPDRLSVSAGQQWVFKERDQYFSKDETWNKWMSGGTSLYDGFDTRSFRILQNASVIFHNTHPLKKIGPVPFEIKLETILPVFTRHTWRPFAVSVQLISYFQWW